MALDFPSSPTLNQTYTDSGKTWQWNGSGWQLIVTGTVTNADISATAEIAVSKLADGAARQLLQTDAAGTGVEWTSNVDIPGTLDVTGAAVFDSTVAVTGALTKSGSNVVTVGDTGTVTSTMIANLTIVDADISTTAEIAVSKLADGAARQLLQTDTAGTGVEWTSNVDIPGTLDVTSTATFDSTISFPLGSAGSPSIYPGTDTNTGFWSPAADTLAVSTAGTERLRIDSSGKLLVGTSSSVVTGGLGAVNQIFSNTQSEALSCHLGYNLDGSSSPIIALSRSRNTTYGSYTAVQSGDSLGRIRFVGDDGSDYASVAAQIECLVDGTPGTNDMPGRLVFSTTADGAASPTEAMRINNQRELLIGTTTRTANGGVLQVSNGITFPATAVACTDVNTLDDYEEGTFTPTVIGTTIAGTASYTIQNGRYTKFGRLVQFELYVFWGGGTGTGNLRVAGLPFTCNGGSTFPAVTIAGQNNVASSANTYLNAYIQQSTTEILINENLTGGGTRTPVAYDAAGELILSGTYSV